MNPVWWLRDFSGTPEEPYRTGREGTELEKSYLAVAPLLSLCFGV